MTKAAKAFGKDVREFLKNSSTKVYIRTLGEMMGIPLITQAKLGYHGNPEVGTYGHPKLAVFFARWLDVRFAVWCDLMVDNILKGSLQVSVAVVPTEEALGLKASLDQARARILSLESEVKELQEKGLKEGDKLPASKCDIFATLTNKQTLQTHDIKC